MILFLGENKFQTNFDCLGNRWADHWNSLCGAKYSITDWETDDMYKCLMKPYYVNTMLKFTKSKIGETYEKFPNIFMNYGYLTNNWN